MKAVIIALGPAYSQAARSVYYFDFRPPQISVFVYRRYEHASFYSRLCTLFVCLAICGAISLPIAAQHTVVGVVFDNSTGGPLPGSNVRVRLSDYGTVTDASGRFEIFDVPSGRLQIRVSFVGYVTKDAEITVPVHGPLHIGLTPDARVIDEVLVEARRARPPLIAQTPISAIAVTELPVRRMPAFLAERDLLRIVQQLPGVKTESDFTGGLYVRGGRNDQNLVLLDGVPIYNPWHLFGLFSAFNTEALDQVTLNKGIFPVRYGGRVSSVLEASLSDPLDSLAASHLSVSIVSAQTAKRFRIGDHTALLIAARRTYLDPFFYMYDSGRRTSDLDPTTRYNFTDANVKLVHQPGGGHRLEANLFYNDDRLRLAEDSYYQSYLSNRYDGRLDWRNVALAFRHQVVRRSWSLNSRVYSTVYTSNFSVDETSWSQVFGPGDSQGEPSSRFLESHRQRLVDVGSHTEFSYPVTDRLHLFAGFEIISHRMSDRAQADESIAGLPEHATIRNESNAHLVTAREQAIFLALNQKAGVFSLFPAVRIERYTPRGDIRVLPRLNLIAQASPRITLSAGAGMFAQYVHVVGNEKASLPTDRWFFSDHDMPPMTSWGATVGSSYTLSEHESYSLEVYYKQYEGIRAYTPKALDDATGGLLPLLPLQTIPGSGESYGLELFYQRAVGRLAGWAGYTLAWSFNRFDEINYGRSFPARADRRHDIQLAISYAPSARWDLGATFKLQTGQPTTLPTQGYLPARDPLGTGRYLPVAPLVLTRTNNYRMPRYHRLDLSATRQGLTVAGRPAEVIISIFNVYNRRNVFDISSGSRIQETPDGGVFVTPKNHFLSQLPIIPMIGLRIDLGGTSDQ